MKSTFLVVLLCTGIDIALSISQQSEIDPKEEFFRHLQFSDSPSQFSETEEQDVLHDIPLPGGLEFPERRLKRSYYILPSRGLTSYFQTHLPTKHKLIKRQNNGSKSINKNLKEENPPSFEESHDDSAEGFVTINDFIRLKRETKSENDQISRLKREPEGRAKKMIMERDFSETRTNDDRDRESRGATKEQWIKQPYPVERPEEAVNDNVPSASASDSIRAPRVHFVTTQQRQRRPEPPAPTSPPVFREREGRSRDRDPYLPTSYPYHHQAPIQPYPMYPRPRSYDPYRPGPRYYEPLPLPYFQRFDDRDRRYGFDDFDDGRPMMLPPPPPPPLPPPAPLPGKQNRRIIYYATLPEVVRSPTSSGNGDQRYSYRSGHDDRYHRSDYHNQKQRDRTRDVNSNMASNTAKTPLFPVKVSTDVNVRQTNKNPERRIYSDAAESRFSYKSPDDGNF